MSKLRVGVQLAPQNTTYSAYAQAVQAVEALGVDTIWNWDHFYRNLAVKPRFSGGDISRAARSADPAQIASNT